MDSIGTHMHRVSRPRGIKPDRVISLFFILVRHSCRKMHSDTLRRVFNYSLCRQLRSSKKKLQSSLTLSLPFHLQTLHPSWHISVHGGSSWAWWLFLIELQGVCSLKMFLEMLHRKPLQSCPISSPSTLPIILLLCYKAEEMTACMKRAVASSLLWFPSVAAGASNSH